ncbi:unnamed protein product, partial [Rangifer tarandus platyrhynchus]
SFLDLQPVACVLVPILVSIPGKGTRCLLTQLSRIQKLPCSGPERSCSPFAGKFLGFAPKQPGMFWLVWRKAVASAPFEPNRRPSGG